PASLLAAGPAPAGHLGARCAGLGEADGDGLLPAGDLLARAPGPERPALALAHGPLDLLRGLGPVLASPAAAATLLLRGHETSSREKRPPFQANNAATRGPVAGRI